MATYCLDSASRPSVILILPASISWRGILLVPSWLKHSLKQKVQTLILYLRLGLNNHIGCRFIRGRVLESATWSYAQLIFRTVIKKLWTCFGPLGRDRSQSQPCLKILIFSVKRKTAIYGANDTETKGLSNGLRPYKKYTTSFGRLYLWLRLH